MLALRPTRAWPILAFAALLSSLGSHAASEADRILSIGGSVTEIVYALGQDHRLVARDTTSSFPPEVKALPNVGYMRALSPEGVLSVDPELIIAEEGSGPPATIDILEEADVDFVTVPDGYNRNAVREKILAVAEALGVPDAGAELAAEIDAELAAAQAASIADTPKRVLFILSTRGGRIMASGTNTAADGIIGLSGGTNAVTDFEGYKLMTDEAVIAAAPDVILMMDRGGNHGADNEELFDLPALVASPAAENESVVRLNGLLLLGFGPRTPEAVTALHAALYGG